MPYTITVGETTHSVEEGVSFLDFAKSSIASWKTFVAVKIDGVVCDLTRPIEKDCAAQFLTFHDPEGQEVFWHSAAHILGEALQRVLKARLCIGPPIAMGFYYDCHIGDRTITEDDIKLIQEAVNQIIRENQPYVRSEATRDECLELFKENPFKCEILNELIKPDEMITLYRCGDFIDLCRGPHVPSTGYIKAFWVQKASGAYWRGDQAREALQRVYGVAFPDSKLLKEHQKFLKEAAERDHRLIGTQQKLFFFSELSPGSTFLLPHGARIYRKLEAFIRGLYRKYGYEEVNTPTIFDANLWRTSGHWDFYKDDMFTMTVDNKEWALKPMNCPGHCVLFKHQKHSYRELPFRCAEFGVLHRNEASGALNGLTRVRRFVQDDAHIFCRRDQIGQEVDGVLRFVKEVYGILNMHVDFVLSTKPEKALGTAELWSEAEAQLLECLQLHDCPYTIDVGGGAFYGPKIDIKVTDALKRKHQCATVQLDFNLPLRFELSYVGEEQMEVPVMIHRAILGSLERFMSMAIENYAGKWPFWLSPRQLAIVPVSNTFDEYALKVRDFFHEHGFYVDADLANKSLNKKVRENQLAQYNFILVVGAEEQKSDSVNIRARNNEVLGLFSLENALKHFQELNEQYK
ncbi:hypothetical protein RCL1_004430 [Eukaryota sp. TZLM3-RCL]